MSTITFSRKELELVMKRFNRSITQDKEMYLMSGSKITMERILNETARRNMFRELLLANPDQQEFTI